jgi:tetratricopeptide (TPR) repeat protein
MYSVLLSIGVGLVVLLAVGAWLGPVTGILPGLVVAMTVFLLLMWQLGKRVQVELDGVLPFLQQRKIAEAKAYMRSLQDRYGAWQPFLRGQIEVQIGMLDYVQLKFDEALPQLESGSYRNWLANVCIGAIHFRRGRQADAWDSFKKAKAASKKESMVYVVWAVLKTRDGDRDGALAVLSDGLKLIPDNKTLKELHDRVANKKRIDTKKLPETWQQIFPEEVIQEHMVRGRAGAPQGPPGPAPKMNRKMRRGR